MTPFDIAAVLVVLAALFGYLNHVFLKLPTTIGLVIIALFVSFSAMGIDALTGSHMARTISGMVSEIDFFDTLMNGMLAFLLFAGALHVELEDLWAERWAIAIMATLGIAISVAIVGLGFAWIAGVPILVALVFGAVVGPTDPVAVLGILKTVKVPRSLETKIAGESLFNDGVGVVLFLILSALAFGGGQGAAEGTGALEVLRLFVVEVGGGAAIGAGAGYGTYWLMKRVDDYVLEVALTLALVMGAYALCHNLHVSGPIAVVIAGLFIGNAGMRFGMSAKTQDHVQKFWHLIDELLNAVLFLLIGFEVFAIPFGVQQIIVALAAILLVLLARGTAISLTVGVLGLVRSFTPGVIPIMTWGGLRGGISVALVLSLPDSEWKPLLLTATYAVVIFSIVVQGLTVKAVIGRFGAGKASP